MLPLCSLGPIAVHSVTSLSESRTWSLYGVIVQGITADRFASVYVRDMKSRPTEANLFRQVLCRDRPLREPLESS
jgi:hypothetical protein